MTLLAVLFTAFIHVRIPSTHFATTVRPTHLPMAPSVLQVSSRAIFDIGRAGHFAIHPIVFQKPFSRPFQAQASMDAVFLSRNPVVPARPFPIALASREVPVPAHPSVVSKSCFDHFMNACTDLHVVSCAKNAPIFSPAKPSSRNAFCIVVLFSVFRSGLLVV